jgi:hypothetical protein
VARRRPIAELEPRITTAYERWTPEDVEAGDTDDRGWVDEDGVSMEPDEYDLEEGLTPVDLAVKFLQSEYVVSASSYPWSKGTWYESSDEDPYSGEREYKHYFLEDFTPAEEREVYAELKRLRAI